ncbi:MAG TPA: ATP-binding protein, partial [Bacteroidota bacterium]
LGWALDVAILKSILPQFVTMKVNTAICFVLLGIALLLWQTVPSDSSAAGSEQTVIGNWKRVLARGCLSIVAIIALLTFSEYVVGWDLGIDQLFALEAPDAIATSSPGRMAPATTINFFSLASVLFLAESKRQPARRIALVLNHVVALISFLSVVGYLYGVEALYGVFSYATMAVHTSLTFLIFSSGVMLSQSDWAIVHLLIADDPGGASLRMLVPAVPLTVILIGLLRLAGEQSGLYDARFGLALYSTWMVVIILPLIWWNAFSLSREDQKRHQLEEALERQTGILNSVLDSMGDGVVVADMDGKFIIWNNAAERLIGLGPSNIPKEAWTEHYGVFLPDKKTPYPPAQLPLARALRGELTDLDEQFIRRPDVPQGIWLAVSGRPLVDQNGKQRGGVVVFNEISERKRAEQEMKQLNAALEMTNKELEAFSYSVSHDLRAPLRHIDGFSDLLLKKSSGGVDEQGKRYLETISKSAKHMGALIDDLLVFSRMGRTEMRTSTVSPEALIREVIANFVHETQGREIHWTIHPLPTLEADRSMLLLVFQNLLGNAIKYTRPRPRADIEVGCTQNDSECSFSVKDNGVGFDMKYVDKLFGVFQRLHRADEFEGTGIGLANVRRIVARHGGKTWAEGAVDQGATIYFTLPLSQASVPDANIG